MGAAASRIYLPGSRQSLVGQIGNRFGAGAKVRWGVTPSHGIGEWNAHQRRLSIPNWEENG